MELELENARQKVPRIRCVGSHMVFGPRIEIRLAALNRRSDALVLGPQRPPRFVVLLRRDLARKYFPAPLVNQQPERQKSDLVQCHLEQVSGVGTLWRDRLQQPHFLQIFRRDGESNGIAYGLMKPVIGAIFKQGGLVLVSALVEIVPKLVVNGDKVFI